MIVFECFIKQFVKSVYVCLLPMNNKAQVLAKPGPVKFKIGYTHNALQRWTMEYKLTYDRMCVLMITPSAIGSKYAESHLIAWFHSRQGIQNEILGGEGPSHFDGPYFVYMVVKRL